MLLPPSRARGISSVFCPVINRNCKLPRLQMGKSKPEFIRTDRYRVHYILLRAGIDPGFFRKSPAVPDCGLARAGTGRFFRTVRQLAKRAVTAVYFPAHCLFLPCNFFKKGLEKCQREPIFQTGTGFSVGESRLWSLFPMKKEGLRHDRHIRANPF